MLSSDRLAEPKYCPKIIPKTVKKAGQKKVWISGFSLPRQWSGRNRYVKGRKNSGGLFERGSRRPEELCPCGLGRRQPQAALQSLSGALQFRREVTKICDSLGSQISRRQHDLLKNGQKPKELHKKVNYLSENSRIREAEKK